MDELNPVAEFLRAHEDVAVPIIEWGGLILLIALILSPFLIIRLSYFYPTRWWHIIGAYIVSFGLYYLLLIVNPFYHWLIYNVFASIDLYSAFSDADFLAFILFILIYPLMVFYSAKMLYGKFNLKRFLLSLLAFVMVSIGVMSFYMWYLIYAVGQLFNALN